MTRHHQDPALSCELSLSFAVNLARGPGDIPVKASVKRFCSAWITRSTVFCISRSLLNGSNLVPKRLILIDSRVEFQSGVNPWGTKAMHLLMAVVDAGHHLIPWPLDRCSIWAELMHKPG